MGASRRAGGRPRQVQAGASPSPTGAPAGAYTWRTLAGNMGAAAAGAADGVGSNAFFSAPAAAALDGLGSLFVADTTNCRLREMKDERRAR